MSVAVPADVVRRIEELLQRPVFFFEILEALSDISYRGVLTAWSEVRMCHDLVRDEHGRYRLHA
jgi:hypothetical protein